MSMLLIYFKYSRKLLAKLCHRANDSLQIKFLKILGIDDRIPGMIMVIQSKVRLRTSVLACSGLAGFGYLSYVALWRGPFLRVKIFRTVAVIGPSLSVQGWHLRSCQNWYLKLRRDPLSPIRRFRSIIQLSLNEI